MEGIGAGGVGQFVDEVEYHVVNLGMERAIAAAVDALIGILAGGFIELRMGAQEAEGVCLPTTDGPAG